MARNFELLLVFSWCFFVNDNESFLIRFSSYLYIYIYIFLVGPSHSAAACVWYCGSFCGCGLKKNCFAKSTFSWDWFGIYICLVKTVVEIEVEQKID
jgi:hypothetical protein